MRELIKQIIREEMGSEWDFIKEVDASFKPKTHIVFEPPLNLRTEIDKLEKIFSYLDSDGWMWCGGKKLTPQNSSSLMGYNYLVGLTLELQQSGKTCISFNGSNGDGVRAIDGFRNVMTSLGWGDYDIIYGRDLI